MRTVGQWVFYQVRRSARRQAAIQNGAEIVFPLCWQAKAIVVFILSGCGFLLFAIVSAGPVPGDPWYIALILWMILISLPLAILLLLPGVVVIDGTGVRQKFWWGRQKFIPWSDFASVIHDRDDHSTILYGKFQPPIAFSPYLIDQSRFDREVMAFSKTQEIRDDL